MPEEEKLSQGCAKFEMMLGDCTIEDLKKWDVLRRLPAESQKMMTSEVMSGLPYKEYRRHAEKLTQPTVQGEHGAGNQACAIMKKDIKALQICVYLQ